MKKNDYADYKRPQFIFQIFLGLLLYKHMQEIRKLIGPVEQSGPEHLIGDYHLML